jgi:hypothetical protein
LAKVDARPPWSSPPQQATPAAQRSAKAASGRASGGSGRRPASGPVRADKADSDAGPASKHWEIIQTGRSGEGDKAP